MTKLLAQLKNVLAERSTRVALGGGAAVALAVGLFLMGQSGGDGFRVLVRGIRLKADVKAITNELEKQGVCCQLSDGGRTISVPEHLFETAVRHVSREKLYPRSREQDMREMMEKSGSLSMLPDMQRMQRTRMQELEIARTISMYDSVEFARVHITQPRETFLRGDAAPVTASIFLELSAGRKLSADQVVAIKALVSHSVEGLSPINITLCDSQGIDYSASATSVTSAPVSPAAVRELELSQLVETVVVGKVTDHLRRLFEQDTFAASVTVELETAPVHPRGNAGRGEAPAARAEETGDGTRAAPPGSFTGPESVSAQIKSVETRGRIRRLSISILIDSRHLPAGRLDPGLRGTVEEGIKAATGFRPQRGDTLSVLVAPFCRAPASAGSGRRAAADRKESASAVAASNAPRMPGAGGHLLNAVFALPFKPAAPQRRRLQAPDVRAGGALAFVAAHFNVLWLSQVSILVFVLIIMVQKMGGAAQSRREPAEPSGAWRAANDPTGCYPVRLDRVLSNPGLNPPGTPSNPGLGSTAGATRTARCIETLLARRDRDHAAALELVDNETLVLALRAATEPLRKAVLANLPAARASEVTGAIAAHGPVALGRMELAQMRVADSLAEAPPKGA